MGINVFLSTVTDEFRAYRDQLKRDFDLPDVSVKVQEDFKDFGRDTLDRLDFYIARCDAVVHLVGDMCGAEANAREQDALIAKHPDLSRKLPPLGQALKGSATLPYTQWEAWLALYHGKRLIIAKAKREAPREPNYRPTAASRAAQADHLARLEAYGRYPKLFLNPDNLANNIWPSITYLLIEYYNREYAQARDRERYMASQIAVYRRARDVALAADDPDGAAEAVVRLASALHGENVAALKSALNEEAESLFNYGRDHGSNVHLVAAIVLRREILRLASSIDKRADAGNGLGVALSTLDERKTGAAADFWSAIEEVALSVRTPLQWARARNNLGNTYKWLKAWGDLIDFT